MTVTLDISDNVEHVIGDVEDTIDDLDGVADAAELSMGTVRQLAKSYIRSDAELSGALRNSIYLERIDTEYKSRIAVGSDGRLAPYNAIVELGSGAHTLTTTEKAGSQNAYPAGMMDEPPREFPFKSPDVNPKKLAPIFEEWMKRKNIPPQKETYAASALAIAKSVVYYGNYAHPYLRPAWFETELQLRRAMVNALRKAVK